MKLKHEKIKKLLPLYIDNGINRNEKEIVKQHLKVCQECQDELSIYQKNYKCLSSLDKKRAPAGFLNTIKNRIGDNMDENKNNSNNMLKKIKKIFNYRLKIPAGVIGLAVIVIIIFLTGLPELLTDNNSYLLQEESRENGSGNTNIYRQKTSETSPESQMDLMKTAPRTTIDNINNINLDKIDTMERKIIKHANLAIEIKEIETVHELIVNLAEKYGGYISNSRSWTNHDDRHFSSYQVRIPVENFNQVLSDLTDKGIGKIISRSISGQDVTEEYLDLEVRLKNLLKQEERYRQLLDKAKDVEDILKIENELNRTRTEIERLQGRKNYLDDRISYSTISVEFREEEPLASAFPGIIKVLKNAVQQMVSHFYRLILLAGTLIPYLLLILIIYVIYRKRQNKEY